jgi:hypothetical protein
MERADRRAFDCRGGEPGTAADPTPVTPASAETPAVQGFERLLRMSRADSRDRRVATRIDFAPAFGGQLTVNCLCDAIVPKGFLHIHADPRIRMIFTKTDPVIVVSYDFGKQASD